MILNADDKLFAGLPLRGSAVSATEVAAVGTVADKGLSEGLGDVSRLAKIDIEAVLLSGQPGVDGVVQIVGPDGVEAVSMRPLLEDPSRPWKKGALMTGGKKGRSVVTERWRYSEYVDAPDGAELFDREKDPGEFVNLAQDPEHAEVTTELAALLRAGWKACLPG